MAQEKMNDFMAMAKAYAVAEKELKCEKWVNISIERIDADGNRTVLHSYDLPRGMRERWEWVVRWREARLRCQYPRARISTFYCFYDKRLGNDPKLTADLHKLTSCKAQVTRQQRIVDEYIAYQRVNNMFFDEETDEQLIKICRKLAVKRADVEAAEERLKNKIEQIKNQNL